MFGMDVFIVFLMVSVAEGGGGGGGLVPHFLKVFPGQPFRYESLSLATILVHFHSPMNLYRLNFLFEIHTACVERIGE